MAKFAKHMYTKNVEVLLRSCCCVYTNRSTFWLHMHLKILHCENDFFPTLPAINHKCTFVQSSSALLSKNKKCTSEKCTFEK